MTPVLHVLLLHFYNHKPVTCGVWTSSQDIWYRFMKIREFELNQPAINICKYVESIITRTFCKPTITVSSNMNGTNIILRPNHVNADKHSCISPKTHCTLLGYSLLSNHVNVNTSTHGADNQNSLHCVHNNEWWPIVCKTTHCTVIWPCSYKLNKYMHASEGIYWTQLLLILLLESGKIQNL